MPNQDAIPSSVGLKDRAQHLIGLSGGIERVPEPHAASFSSGIAVALPSPGRRTNELDAARSEARGGDRRHEVRIGIGPLGTWSATLRMLGAAERHADAIFEAGRVAAVDRVCLVSSAPKAGSYDDAAGALCALVAFSAALRFAEVSCDISVDIASRDLEVSPRVAVPFPDELAGWLRTAQSHAGSEVHWATYAVEHAAASMFGDVATDADQVLRATVGPATEGRFWAARRLVVDELSAEGLRCAPSYGLILKALQRPWYARYEDEPLLGELLTTPSKDLLDRLKRVLLDGQQNTGLKAEWRAVKRMLSPELRAQSSGDPDYIERAQMFLHEIAHASIDPRAACVLAQRSRIGIGERLSAAI